jgi:hypothetical protein
MWSYGMHGIINYLSMLWPAFANITILVEIRSIQNCCSWKIFVGICHKNVQQLITDFSINSSQIHKPSDMSDDALFLQFLLYSNITLASQYFSDVSDIDYFSCLPFYEVLQHCMVCNFLAYGFVLMVIVLSSI